MKIALVSPYSWSVPGGVNMHVRDLSEELIARGHESRILGVSESGDTPGIVRVGRTAPIPINSGIARVAISPTLIGRVRTALRRATPDLIHIHEPFVSTASIAALMVAKAPVVATFHSGAETRAYRRLRPALQPLWNKIAVRIAVSNAARGLVEEAFGPGARIIPNGVDLSAFGDLSPPPNDQSVLFFGRLEPRKGAQVLADAWPKVIAEVPEAKLVLAGDGGLRSSLERVLADFDVTFAGAYDRLRLRQLLEDCDVACLPAVGGESFGITLLEAMAAHRPLVATAIAGYTSVVRNSKEGLMVPPSDPEALAAGLIKMLQDPALRKATAEGGTVRAHRFGWAKVTSEIEEAYQDALAGGKSS